MSLAEIIKFQRIKDNDHHLSGEAVCLECQHRWTAVVPVGVDYMDCPNCGTNKGVWHYRTAAVDDTRWVCTCGGDAHYVLPEQRCQCIRCGLVRHIEEMT